MADAHLETALRSIDLRHPLAKQGAMDFTATTLQINPGVNHLVAQRAFHRLLGKHFKHRAGEDDFTSTIALDSGTTAIEAGGSAHPAVTPAHGDTRLPGSNQHTIEMLAIEPMEQRKQGQQGQSADLQTNQRHPASVSQTRRCSEGW